MSNPANALVAFEIVGRDLFLKFASGAAVMFRGTVNAQPPADVQLGVPDDRGARMTGKGYCDVHAGPNHFTFPGGGVEVMQTLELPSMLPDDFPLYLHDSGEYLPAVGAVFEDGAVQMVAGREGAKAMTVSSLTRLRGPRRCHWHYRMQDGGLVRLFSAEVV